MKKIKLPEAEKKAEEEEEEEADEEEKEVLEEEEEKKGKTKRVCISLGESLLGKIDEEAEAEERSRSGYIARKLRALHKR